MQMRITSVQSQHQFCWNSSKVHTIFVINMKYYHLYDLSMTGTPIQVRQVSNVCIGCYSVSILCDIADNFLCVCVPAQHI